MPAMPRTTNKPPYARRRLILSAQRPTANEPSVGGRAYEVRVDDGKCVTIEGRGSNPDVVLAMGVDTLNGLFLEGLQPAHARSTGQVTVSGNPDALNRFVRMFAIRHGSRRDDAQCVHVSFP